MAADSDSDRLFFDSAGQPRRLWGVNLYSASTRLAELAGQVGMDVVWIDMEHGPTDFTEAENLCYAARAAGAIPLIRLPDAERNHVLRALEIGARLIVVPMVDTPELAAQLVRHGKFPPVGQRGLNSRTPGNRFGLDEIVPLMQRANERTSLFVQIETRQAVTNLEAICATEGLDGIFVGPSDLAVSYGRPGQLNDPDHVELVTGIVRHARQADKLAGILVSRGALFDAAVEAGCQLIISGSDVSELSRAWSEFLQSVPR